MNLFLIFTFIQFARPQDFFPFLIPLKIAFVTTIIIVIFSIFLFISGGEDTQENHTNTIESPKKTYLDSPTNIDDRRVEAKNIANTIQNPVNTYLNSRVDARGLAKKSVNESNKRIEEQDKAMEALMK